jgi:hypothetical protein
MWVTPIIGSMVDPKVLGLRFYCCCCYCCITDILSSGHKLHKGRKVKCMPLHVFAKCLLVIVMVY